MSLGQRFFQWLQQVSAHAFSVFPLNLLAQLLRMFYGFISTKPPDATQAIINAIGSTPVAQTRAWMYFLHALTGKPLPAGANTVELELQKMQADPAGYLAGKIVEAQGNPGAQAAAKQLHSLIHSSVFQPLLSFAAQAGVDPLTSLAEVQASVMALKAAGHAVGVAAEILGLGQIQTVDAAIEDLFKGLGLDELSALMLRPLFETGITPAAERFYNAQFRPSRLSPDQLVQLVALGIIGQGEMQTEAAQEGWRDEDIRNIQELVYDRVGPSDILAARDLGIIGDGEALNRLQQKRFHPNDAQFLLTLSAYQRRIDWSQRVFNLALKDYLKYKIDDNKLAAIARAAGFSDERVTFEIAVAKMTRDSDTTDLSVGEVEQAFKANVISEAEAATYLSKIQIDPSGIPILIQTWRDQKTKAPLRLNASELTTAFHDGIITQDQLSQKLRDLGWNSEDVRILVQIAQWRAPEKPRELSESIIVTAFHHKIVDQKQAVALLQKLGFTEEQGAFILRAETILPAQKQKELTAAEIGKLNELGVLSDVEAETRFVRMGYSKDDAALLLVALTTKVPKSATTTKPKA